MYCYEKAQTSVNHSLPLELEYFIFSVLNAKYETKRNVDNNLTNDEERNRLYLGTYFPRSYTESNKICENLFRNNIIKSKYNCSTEISILDIGSGTGGNLLGMLYAVKNCLPSIKNVNILSIDGNDVAIDFQKRIINHCQVILKLNINIVYKKHIFLSDNLFEELAMIIKNTSFMKFNFIMSFKFINEFYNKVYINKNFLYKHYLDFSAKYLDANGLSILLDVTSQDIYKKRKFLPMIITEEIVPYLKLNDNKLKILLPLSCAFKYKICKGGDCFTQNIYFIRHQKTSKDISKFCSFVFGKPKFVEEILNNEKIQNNYITCYKCNSSIVYPGGSCINGINTRSVNQNLSVNAFKLNN